MNSANRRDVLKMIGVSAALGAATTAGASPIFEGFGSARRRTFLLLHGAWHNGVAWNGVADSLRDQGHEVVVPTLPGAAPGESPFGIEFSDYVDAVTHELKHLDRKAIVVAHSSAAMLVQAAAPRVPKAIDAMVFVNAFIMADGETQLDNLPAEAAAGITALADLNGGTVPIAPLEGFVRGALMEGDAAETQDALLQILVDQPFSLFSTPVDTTAFEALDIPRAYLFCKRDQSADYLGMATRLERYEVIAADGSHEMLFSAPSAFTRALLALVTRDRR